MTKENLTSVLVQDYEGSVSVEVSDDVLGEENWASFAPVTVTTGEPGGDSVQRKRTGYQKGGRHFPRRATYEVKLVTTPSTLKDYSVNGARYSYSKTNHTYELYLHKLRLTDQSGVAEFVTEKTRAAAKVAKNTVIGFWDAVHKMMSTALGRLAAVILGPLLLAGFVVGAVNIPWSSVNLMPLLTFVLYVLVLIAVVSLPSVVIAGILWLVTPSKAGENVDYPKINVIQTTIPWKGMRVDLERTQRKTHERLLSLMKKFAFRKALPVAVSWTAIMQIITYIILAIFVFDVSESNAIPYVMTIALSFILFLWTMAGISDGKAEEANEREAAEQLVLYVEQTNNVSVPNIEDDSLVDDDMSSSVE